MIGRGWEKHAGQFERWHERADPADLDSTRAFVKYVVGLIEPYLSAPVAEAAP